MLNRLPDHDTLYSHLVRRDAEMDGVIYVGVKTTGIFCRPVCPARTPLAKNIIFYGSPDEALAAGFRPCKRCRPLDDPNGAPAVPATVRYELFSICARPPSGACFQYHQEGRRRDRSTTGCRL
mgnify:CR=1 FL=1